MLPEVPIQRKVKLPVNLSSSAVVKGVLTPLPTVDEHRFSSKTSGEGVESAKHYNKDKSDTNHDLSEHAHQHKPSPHYEITSSGLRWLPLPILRRFVLV